MEDPAEKVDRIPRWWGTEIPGRVSPSETTGSVGEQEAKTDEAHAVSTWPESNSCQQSCRAELLAI